MANVELRGAPLLARPSRTPGWAALDEFLPSLECLDVVWR